MLVRAEKEPGTRPGSRLYQTVMSIKTAVKQRLMPCSVPVGALGYTLLPRREKYQMAAITMMISRITHQ